MMSHISVSHSLHSIVKDSRLLGNTFCKVKHHHRTLQCTRKREQFVDTPKGCTALAPYKIKPTPALLKDDKTKNLPVLSTPIEANLDLHIDPRDVIKAYSYTADDILAGDMRKETTNIFKANLDSDCLDMLFGVKDLPLPKNVEEIQNDVQGNDKICTDVEKVSNIAFATSLLIKDIIKVCEESIINMDMSLSPNTPSLGLCSSADSGHNINHKSSVNSVLMSNIVFMAPPEGDNPIPQKDQDPLDREPTNKPNMDQLRRVQDYLAEVLPSFFVTRHDYRIYSPDVIFANNYWEKPYSTKGISKYVLEMSKTRMSAHFKYANVKFQVMKITAHEDEGSIKVRWRITGIPQVRAIMFWKFLPWRYNNSMGSESDWHDGLSTLYLDGSGIIYKHQVDSVIPDDERAQEVVKKTSLMDKLKRVTKPQLKPALGANS